MRLFQRAAWVTTQVLLTLAYLFGIGIVALFARIVGTRLLRAQGASSMWERPTGSNTLERMY